MQISFVIMVCDTDLQHLATSGAGPADVRPFSPGPGPAWRLHRLGRRKGALVEVTKAVC